jgi:hypothetical protein
MVQIFYFPNYLQDGDIKSAHRIQTFGDGNMGIFKTHLLKEGKILHNGAAKIPVVANSNVKMSPNQQ